jgi:predicted metal-dependent phosphoesterase TrpH
MGGMDISLPLRAELHCHTYHSKDCRMRPARMIETCLARGINVLAVTDHNKFDGAPELASLAPEGFRVIPGEEIKTSEGEIIGYFLTEYIPRGLSPEETAERIRGQGGVVNVPHPFDTLRGSPLSPGALDRLVGLGLVDMIEGLNARITRPGDNDAAMAYAGSHGLPVTAGSDAHSYGEIGAAWMELPPFDGPRDFARAVREGRLCGGLSPWPVHFTSTWAKLVKKVGLE